MHLYLHWETFKDRVFLPFPSHLPSNHQTHHECLTMSVSQDPVNPVNPYPPPKPPAIATNKSSAVNTSSLYSGALKIVALYGRLWSVERIDFDPVEKMFVGRKKSFEQGKSYMCKETCAEVARDATCAIALYTLQLAQSVYPSTLGD
jgi:hypothetical protein